jgi:hypothetical protein
MRPWQVVLAIGVVAVLGLVFGSDLLDSLDSGPTTFDEVSPTLGGSSEQVSVSRTLEGGGERATEAFRLEGDYVVTITTGSDCFYGFDLDNADTSRTEESLGLMDEPGSMTTNLFAIPSGRYFIDVITGPAPSCPWTVTIEG